MRLIIHITFASNPSSGAALGIGSTLGTRLIGAIGVTFDSVNIGVIISRIFAVVTFACKLRVAGTGIHSSSANATGVFGVLGIMRFFFADNTGVLRPIEERGETSEDFRDICGETRGVDTAEWQMVRRQTIDSTVRDSSDSTSGGMSKDES